LLGGAPAILYGCAAEGDFPATFVSENVLRLFGYGAAEFAQAGFWRERIHPQDHERVFATAGKILEGGNYSVEYRFLHADGAYRWVRDTGSVVRDESGEPVEIVGFWLDITDAKRRQEELQEQEKLHLLAGVLLLAQEEERKRISRELHDDLNQRLAVLALDVALLERDTPALSGELRERLHALKERVGGLSDGVRRIALRLHPARVEQVGLAPAVRFECEAHARQSGIQILFRARRVPSDVPEETALCVYRVAQEALRNIVKHSGASCAEVYLEQAADELVLSVSDDGRGFDSALPSEGLGLISMRERIRMVNGVFALDSAGDSGTRIEVRVPMGAA
jgi:PAS domain S-box-containing protein